LIQRRGQSCSTVAADRNAEPPNSQPRQACRHRDAIATAEPRNSDRPSPARTVNHELNAPRVVQHADPRQPPRERGAVVRGAAHGQAVPLGIRLEEEPESLT
jgi:hypothetical protein